MVTQDAPNPYWFVCWRLSDRTLRFDLVFPDRASAVAVARGFNEAWGSSRSLPDPNRYPLQVRYLVVSAREVQECPTVIRGVPAGIRVALGLPAPFAD